MNQSDLVNHLYDELSFQHELYFWTAGSLITIIVLVVGFYSYQQWRFSNKGIKHMRNKFKKRFRKEFGILEMQQMMANAQKMIAKLTEVTNENEISKKELDNKIKENEKVVKEIRSQNLSLGIRNRTTIIQNENDEFKIKYLISQISELFLMNEDVKLDTINFYYTTASLTASILSITKHKFKNNNNLYTVKDDIKTIKESINNRSKSYSPRKDNHDKRLDESSIKLFNKSCDEILNKDMS